MSACAGNIWIAAEFISLRSSLRSVSSRLAPSMAPASAKPGVAWNTRQNSGGGSVNSFEESSESMGERSSNIGPMA